MALEGRKLKSFKVVLTDQQEYYLKSVATQRYVQTGKSAAQIWFDLFSEELSRMNLTVIDNSVLKELQQAASDQKEKK